MERLIIIGSVLIALAISAVSAAPAPDTCTVSNDDGVSVTVSGESQHAGVLDVIAYKTGGRVASRDHQVERGAYAISIPLLDSGTYRIEVTLTRKLQRDLIAVCEFVR